MAKALPGTTLLGGTLLQTDILRSVWALRLVTGLIVSFGAITFFLGTTWDIQWHQFIGRDRTLIPPHIIMLSGVTICGLAALTVVLIETIQARHGSKPAQQSTHFADTFHGSLGAYVAGFGALTSAIAFPLDSYWHAIYGIDVTIWAPFHIMILGGMSIAALGAAYMLIAAAHGAERADAKRAKRAGYIGTLVAFSTMVNILTLLTINGLDTSNFIILPGMTLTVFPFLIGILGAWTFAAVIYAVPWRWAATITCGISFLFLLIAAALIPPAMDFLMALEHLTFRAVIVHGIDPHLPIVPLQWVGLSLLLPALLLDLFAPMIRKKAWTSKTQIMLLAFLSWPVCIPLMPIDLPISLELWHEQGIGFLVSLFIVGLLGTAIGTQLGRGMGEVMQQLER